MEDLLECNILNVLQCKETEDSVLQRIMTSFSEFRAQVLTTTDELLAHKAECTNKNESNAEIISQIYSQVKDVESKLDDTLLQQKIVDRQISNSIGQQEMLRRDIEQARLQRENLSLELVDLRRELEEKKEEKKRLWDAIKRACRVFKNTLQFHISILETEENGELFRISFFTQANIVENEYYVNLLCFEGCWKVKHINPSLKLEHKDKLKDVVDFSKENKVLDVTAFLCKVRHIFLKYYFKR